MTCVSSARSGKISRLKMADVELHSYIHPRSCATRQPFFLNGISAAAAANNASGLLKKKQARYTWPEFDEGTVLFGPSHDGPTQVVHRRDGDATVVRLEQTIHQQAKL